MWTILQYFRKILQEVSEKSENNVLNVLLYDEVVGPDMISYGQWKAAVKLDFFQEYFRRMIH